MKIHVDVEQQTDRQMTQVVYSWFTAVAKPPCNCICNSLVS